VPGIEIEGGIDLNHFGRTAADLKNEWTGQLVTA
jgi:hypothetical protein